MTILGLVLCVLAALFSMEAKLAWYIPSSNPATQISASKLQQADAPRMIAHALSSSDCPVPHLPELAKIVAFVRLTVEPGRIWRTADTRPERLLSDNFSPHVFFRPPPTL